MERDFSVVSGDHAGHDIDRESPSMAGRQPPRGRPKLPLPTERLKLDTQQAALRAFATASRRGEEAVGAREVAARIGVSDDTAALVNSFFVAAKFVTKEGKGKYKPVPAVNEYTRLHGLDPEAAVKHLADQIGKTWYFTEVARELEIAPATEDVLINVLASAAGVGAERRAQLSMVLEWLTYTRLIEPSDDGRFRLVGNVANDHAGAEVDHGDGPDDPDDPKSTRTTKDGRGKTPARGPQVFGFNFDISLTAEDLAKLTPEQIAATFEAVGKVLAINTNLKVTQED